MLLPLLAISFAYKYLRGGDAGGTEPAETFDPNAEIARLDARFGELRETTRETLAMSREAPAFPGRVAALVKQWDAWIAEYDKLFAPIKNEDGSWPEAYRSYSELKSRAGQMKLDLIKASPF
jgi:hypothetical protein